jgi:excisionase family DNA binding protein
MPSSIWFPLSCAQVRAVALTPHAGHEQKVFARKRIAEYLHVSIRHIRELQARRAIPFYRLGRVVIFDLEEVTQALALYKTLAIDRLQLEGGAK